MNQPTSQPPPEARSPHWPTAPRLSLAVMVFAGVTLVAAASVLSLRAPATSARVENDSADAGFARDMQSHHAQAVEMAFLIRDRSDDELIRTIAYDMITAQQQQMGQMFSWLRLWGLPQTGDRPAMQWMAGTGHGGSHMDGSGTPASPAAADGRMPGMASGRELALLSAADGKTAEVLWLRLMIRHHEAGVAMAQAALDLASRAEVQALADAIVAAQRTEIEQLEGLLEARV